MRTGLFIFFREGVDGRAIGGGVWELGRDGNQKPPPFFSASKSCGHA
jgi:hypothetical protein